MNDIAFECPRCSQRVLMDSGATRMMVICPYCAEALTVSVPALGKGAPHYGIGALVVPILGWGLFLGVFRTLPGAPEDLDYLVLAGLVLVVSLLAGLLMAIASVRRERALVLPILSLLATAGPPLLLLWLHGGF